MRLGSGRSGWRQEHCTRAKTSPVIAWQFAQAMTARKISKTEMAARMHTSRMVANRLWKRRTPA